MLVNGISFKFNHSFLFFFSVVIQSYEIDVGKEYVIDGNDALLKCKVASFVGDFVSIESWRVDDLEIGTKFDNGKEACHFLQVQ